MCVFIISPAEVDALMNLVSLDSEPGDVFTPSASSIQATKDLR